MARRAQRQAADFQFRRAQASLEKARLWLASGGDDSASLEAGARRFALTVGRTFTDPAANVSITLTALSATSASVRVGAGGVPKALGNEGLVTMLSKM